MIDKINYLIGVDGGGTGTRVVVTDVTGIELARGSAGASGLINGIDFAWNSILKAVDAALAGIGQPRPALSEMAIGLGLAGVHNKQWAANFSGKNPGFAKLKLETDAFTTLLGAHGGQPGVIVAVGTGSVGESLSADGVRCEVGGWGFPCGDEGGGAWIGFQAINYLQQVTDGRVPRCMFSDALLHHCGGTRDAIFNWLAGSNQGTYAQIAPLVVAFANQKANPAAIHIMQKAAHELVKVALALDYTNTLPVALCGGLAHVFYPYLPTSLVSRITPPHGDSAAGALLLIKKELESNPC